jgi:hypothetical protein
MNAEQVKELANKEINAALACVGMDGIFKTVPGGELDSIEDEYFSFEYEVIFEYGNIKRTHSFQIGWNDTDGVGLEYGEDGDINPITYGSLMTALYFDMALEGFDDKYVA